MGVLLTITGLIGGLMAVMTLYQIIYVIIGFFAVKKWPEAKTNHKYGFLVVARNEAGVIGQLIESIKSCDYDQSKIRIFVIADNCSDNTAEIAKNAGATVFERFNNDNSKEKEIEKSEN